MISVWDYLRISELETQDRIKSSDNCIVEGCEQPFHKGYCLCINHYREFQIERNGGEAEG